MRMRELAPRDKAAVLMIMLGKEHAAKIYKYLSEEEVEQITLSITSMGMSNRRRKRRF